jgi:hypothetical protein
MFFLKEFRGTDNRFRVTTQSTTESLQNEVLRPILKLQNDFICSTAL